MKKQVSGLFQGEYINNQKMYATPMKVKINSGGQPGSGLQIFSKNSIFTNEMKHQRFDYSVKCRIFTR
jgi:hypothetical protein